MNNANNSAPLRTAPLRIQTGVRAGTMKQFFGRVWAGIESRVGSRDDSHQTPNAVGGVRG